MDRIRLNASEWMDFRSGEKKCFLLTNGLGGYCSLTVMGNAARNDQALLMGGMSGRRWRWMVRRRSCFHRSL